MKFDELDQKMRVFETAQDLCVLPEMFMVARIDGRNFTRLTRETHQFAAPFDEQFRDLMVETTAHLMNCGFRIVYGYTQSDEISLLFHRDEHAFGRKLRKYESILAGEASAKFALLLGSHAAFDCRLSQLPNAELVVDYFRWRSEDAHRNALNGYCYWQLRKEGQTAGQATKMLHRLTVAEKNELLFQRGINFNDLPNWQKRGIGLCWETYAKPAVNPKTGEAVTAERRRLKVEFELPMKDRYSAWLAPLMAEVTSAGKDEKV
jgi:tRNA(His) 5'-end guanylyltransferase